MADATQKFHILLVEDNDDHAMLIQLALEDHSLAFTLDRLCDGEEALQYIRREGEYENRKVPDLVLLDINLPKVNGHEVLDELRKNKKLTAVPVVMLTTSNSEKDRELAYKLHVNSYLVKPLDAAKFQTMVQDLHQYWAIWNQNPSIAS